MTLAAPNPTEDNAMKSIGDFLTSIVPADCPVRQAQPNRVPEPQEGDFVLMTPRNRPRLSTNLTGYADATFVGSIAGAVMTVTEILTGDLGPGRPVFGPNVADGTAIVSGGPGVGDYVIAPSQTVVGQNMAAGVQTVEQSTEFVVQIDVHGPNSGDVVQTISTMLRSAWGVDQFAAQDPNYGVAPLYTDEPKQLPFGNDQQQQESRWMTEAYFQIKPVVTVPQQFADQAVVGLINVDAAYPAAP